MIDPITKERWEIIRDKFDQVIERWKEQYHQLPLSFKDVELDAMDGFYDAIDGMFMDVFIKDDTPFIKFTWTLLSEEDLSTIDGFCGPNGYAIFRAWCARHNIECK